MDLNRYDPVHVALIELAFAASQLVDDLHDYQHFMGGREGGPFSIDVIEQHYVAIAVAWDRFHDLTTKERALNLPPADQS